MAGGHETQVAYNESAEQQGEFTGTIGVNSKSMVLVVDFNLPSSMWMGDLTPIIYKSLARLMMPSASSIQ